jgi:hypothetical protein
LSVEGSLDSSWLWTRKYHSFGIHLPLTYPLLASHSIDKMIKPGSFRGKLRNRSMHFYLSCELYEFSFFRI